jgi:hypothetical protein
VGEQLPQAAQHAHRQRSLQQGAQEGELLLQVLAQAQARRQRDLCRREVGAAARPLLLLLLLHAAALIGRCCCGGGRAAFWLAVHQPRLGAGGPTQRWLLRGARAVRGGCRLLQGRWTIPRAFKVPLCWALLLLLLQESRHAAAFAAAGHCCQLHLLHLHSNAQPRLCCLLPWWGTQPGPAAARLGPCREPAAAAPDG